MYINFILIGVTLAAFAVLGFMLNRSIKQLEIKKRHEKKKKGRTKYMPQVKNF